jgi:glyoxylase-like metal-dependent hydrolase (beta-lactamase superfamily II)
MEAVQRLSIGATECALVHDGELAVDPQVLFPRARRDRWPSYPANAQGQAVVPVICLVVWTCDGQVVLIDAGNGNHPGARFPGGGLLPASLREVGVQPEDVNVVIFTHGHTDHVSGSTAAGKPMFPRARHVIADADWMYFTQQRQPRPAYVEKTLLPLANAGLVDRVTPDVEITREVQLVAAPGHTPGNCVVRVGSDEQALFFLGDLVHNIAEIEHLDLMPDCDVQPDLVPGSRRNIFERAVREGALVAASHLPWPAVGHLTTDGSTFGFEPIA